MRYLITQIFALHWLLLFGLLAAASAGGLLDLAALTGLSVSYTAAHSTHGMAIAGALTVSFGLTSAMFLWVLLTNWVGVETEQGGEGRLVATLAHGVALATVSAMLLLVVATGQMQVLAPAFLMVALVGVSFAAMRIEYGDAWEDASSQDLAQAATRVMALGAAHSSLLSKLAGRGPHRDGEGAT